MSTATLRPIALAEGEGDVFWSFGVLATVKASSDETGGTDLRNGAIRTEGSGVATACSP
jgi:hypothetical protein